VPGDEGSAGIAVICEGLDRPGLMLSNEVFRAFV